jgi:osmotically-inducible protein OsmY
VCGKELAVQNDLLIQQRVLDQLRAIEGFDCSTIGIEVHHGVVKLAGRVNDFSARAKAERAARSVDDVRSVILDFDLHSR